MAYGGPCLGWIARNSLSLGNSSRLYSERYESLREKNSWILRHSLELRSFSSFKTLFQKRFLIKISFSDRSFFFQLGNLNMLQNKWKIKIHELEIANVSDGVHPVSMRAIISLFGGLTAASLTASSSTNTSMASGFSGIPEVTLTRPFLNKMLCSTLPFSVFMANVKFSHPSSIQISLQRLSGIEVHGYESEKQMSHF